MADCVFQLPDGRIVGYAPYIVSHVDHEPWSGCILCLAACSLCHPHLCDICLHGMGYQLSPTGVRYLFEVLWESIWAGSPQDERPLKDSQEYRQFMGIKRETPSKRPYTGPRGGSIFEKVKSHVDLAEYAGRRTDLRGAGPGKLKGRCPLHQERSGSFYIFEEKRTWRCFGACADGGDVIKLAQRLFSLDTPKDAAIMLAKEYGIPVAPRPKPHRPRRIAIEVKG